MSRLDRFISAQDSPAGGFASALAELTAGRKEGHWIWYVFPQLSGLGSSSSSLYFGIDGETEATEYLSDPRLSARLLEATGIVLAQLRRGVPLERLMGSRIDALKLISSLTLFQPVAGRLYDSGGAESHRALAVAAAAVLDLAAAQGYPRCAFTLSRLSSPGWP